MDKKRSRDALAREKKEFSIRLGKRIQSIRKEKGLTQEALAERAEVHPKYIGNIETAYYSPSAYAVWKLAKAMKVDLGDLLNSL
jgi:XRE family transcriptional regulator, regulator of sulfur utilization